MRTASLIVAIALLSGSTALAADTPPASTRIMLSGLSEMRFHPLAGSFEVRIGHAKLSRDEDAVRVYINDQPLAAADVHPSDARVRVDYRFRPGLNEILVEATDREGRQLRTDALVFAGDNGLSIDVSDANNRPVDDARVRITLIEQASVRFDGRTSGGNLFVTNLPPGDVSVEVRGAAGASRRVVDTATGYVSLTLTDTGRRP